MRVILKVVEGPHAGREFVFEQHDTFFVGRSVKAHFSLPRQDRYFSRMHFLIEINPPLARVVDLGSRNGTYVNGSRVESADLRNGDHIRAGRSVFGVTIFEEEIADHLVPTKPAGTAAELADRFEKEWLAGRRPLIEDFANAVGAPARLGLLRELVLLDMEMRIDATDSVRVEDYFERFPELKGDEKWLLDLVVAECTFRRRRELGLTVEEFVRRFPTLRGQILERLAPSVSEAVTILPSDGHPPEDDARPRIPGYRLEEELGRGGMGVVYRARDISGRTVALKLISPAVTGGASAVQRFLREADILRRLAHRHIVAFRALGEANGLLWFAMDLIEGSDAAKLVGLDGPLDPERAVRLMLPVLGALTYAHASGFVHRDIKPHNLLVTRTPTGEEALLADFGLARTYEASRLSGLSVAGALGGTPSFVAPEQVLSLRDAKPPADQYGAAATLYFLLTGKAPYDPEPNMHLQFLRVLEEDPVPLRTRRPDLPEGLGAAIHRALARLPSERYADVSAFAADLQSLRDANGCGLDRDGRLCE